MSLVLESVSIPSVGLVAWVITPVISEDFNGSRMSLYRHSCKMTFVIDGSSYLCSLFRKVVHVALMADSSVSALIMSLHLLIADKCDSSLHLSYRGPMR